MRFLGKMVGLVAGFLLFRNGIGIAIGLAIGHAWDAGYLDPFLPRRTHDGALVAPLFALAGAVAKADGRVSEQEVAATERLVARMELDAGKRARAVEHFNRGKQAGFDAVAAARDLRQFCGFRGELKLMLLDVLLDVGVADGQGLAPGADTLLKQIARTLDVAEQSVEWLQQRRHAGARAEPQRPRSVDPYAVLGLTGAASDADIRRAYRKLIAQHHPDKLHARGATPDMIASAEARARELNAAYEQIKTLRGIA